MGAQMKIGHYRTAQRFFGMGDSVVSMSLPCHSFKSQPTSNAARKMVNATRRKRLLP